MKAIRDGWRDQKKGREGMDGEHPAKERRSDTEGEEGGNDHNREETVERCQERVNRGNKEK